MFEFFVVIWKGGGEKKRMVSWCGDQSQNVKIYDDRWKARKHEERIQYVVEGWVVGDVSEKLIKNVVNEKKKNN